MISSNDFRNGTMFEMDGQLLSVVNVEHIKLARAGAVIKAKLRNVRTGSIFEQSFRSGDKYRSVRIEKSPATYLYNDGDHYFFMDSATYDQVPLSRSTVEEVLPYVGQAEPEAPAGVVRVANEVIASIAAMAACEIDGVAGMDENNARHFGDWVRRQTAHRGVRIQLDQERTIHLEVFLAVKADAP